MANFRAKGVIALFVLLILGCSTSRTEPVRIDNVSRVMMHERGRYTLMVEEPDGRISLRSFGGSPCFYPETVLFHDVPEGDPMWATYRTVSRSCENPCEELTELHVHSAEDINGAGWNHGKFGSGQTTVVE